MPQPAWQAELERLREENAELRGLMSELLAWLRVGTFDEAEGEREIRERARGLLDRYS